MLPARSSLLVLEVEARATRKPIWTIGSAFAFVNPPGTPTDWGSEIRSCWEHRARESWNRTTCAKGCIKTDGKLVVTTEPLPSFGRQSSVHRPSLSLKMAPVPPSTAAACDDQSLRADGLSKDLVHGLPRRQTDNRFPHPLQARFER